MTRTRLSIDRELQQKARQRAAQRGVSVAECVRQAVECDLGRAKRSASAVFDLGTSGGSDVARDKDEMIGRAVAAGRGATLARRILREGLDAREARERRRKLAADYAAGRSDARELLGSLETPQLDWFAAED
jgi:hypothetical protein